MIRSTIVLELSPERSVDVYIGSEDELNSLSFKPPKERHNFDHYGHSFVNGQGRAVRVVRNGIKFMSESPLHIERTSLSREEIRQIRESILIKCGTVSEYEFPRVGRNYEHVSEEAIGKKCKKLAKNAVQLAWPHPFCEEEDHPWHKGYKIAYLCELHTDPYVKDLKQRHPELKINQYGTGLVMNIDEEIIPSRVFVADSFKNIIPYQQPFGK